MKPILVYLTDEEHDKLRKQSFVTKKPMSLLLKGSYFNPVRVVTSLTPANTINPLPYVPPATFSGKQNGTGNDPEKYCEHMKKYKDCKEH